MDNENKISVVINTHNAESKLAQVLDTVKGFDEVVICDMESTDHTLEIAGKYGCKIVTFPKKDYVSAEPARTFAIQSASHKWVLVVDADELVTPALKDYLYERISHADCPAGIYIPRKNSFMNIYLSSLYPDYQLRFFIREGTVWPPYVHTFPKVNGTLEHIPEKREDLAFIHLADYTIRNVIGKMNQYTENEMVKRADKGYGMAALFYRPFWRFFLYYFLKGGIRDGKYGFIRGCFDGIYQFVLVSKIIENRKHK
jgi:glycosyltransferase involved in cell wall biosynthesis